MNFWVKLLTGFIFGYILTLIGLTAEDTKHGISFTSALGDFHHHIIPVIAGCISCFILWNITRKEGSPVEINLRFNLIAGFFLGYMLTLIGLTSEDVAHGITIISSLGDFHHHLFPIIAGCIFGVFLWKITGKENALSVIKEKFNLVTEQSPSVYELYDLDGLQIEVNQAYEDLWQFPEGRETTVGKFNIFKSKEVEETGLLAYIKKAYAGESVLVPPYEFDPRGETEANEVGRVRWLSTKIYPLKIHNKTTNIVIAHEDISERIRAEKEKAQLEAQTIRSSQLATLGELSAGVAHEINNPIGGIINYAEMILNKANSDSVEVDLSKRIIKEGERIAEIVKQLLSFSRKDEVEHRLHDIQSLIDVPLSLLGKKLEHDGINVEISVDENISLINCNAQQIEQVLLNLISNASYALNKKNTQAKEEKKIQISAKRVMKENAPFMLLEVKDYGIGIPEDVVPDIFNTFYTTKEIGAGTGLGLNISENIIKLHGGEIGIDSVEWEYTKVTIELPM